MSNPNSPKTLNLHQVFVFGCSLLSLIFGLFNIVWWVSSRIPPNVLEFTIKSDYKEKESVILENTRVCDDNGAKNIDKVTFWLIVDEDGKPKERELGAATPVTITNNCAKFTYEIKEKLKPDHYKLKSVTADINKNQLTITKEFKVNAPPKNLTFSFQKSYEIGETIEVKSVKVCDDNGSSDIQKIIFSLSDEQNIIQKDSSLEMTSSQNKSDKNKSQAVKKPCTASRNHEVSRLKLAAGNYKLTVYAIDGSKVKSDEITKDIKVNAPPKDISFRLDKSTYNFNEKIVITTTKFCDDNGGNDIEKVVFYYRPENGTWQSFGQISSTDFSVSSDKPLCAISSYGLARNLTLPGNYELQATGYDKESETSESEIQKFTVIEPSTPSKFNYPQTGKQDAHEALVLWKWNQQPQKMLLLRVWMVLNGWVV